jgi:hypothetical protein
MKLIVLIFAYTAYCINAMLVVLFFWMGYWENWYWWIACVVAIIIIPFVSRAILLLMRKLGMVKDI